jgi:hypothetical protein
MRLNGQEITRDMMPSFEIGKNYPLRQFQFMQDTLNNALNKNAMQPMQGQPVNSAQQSNAWNGDNK